jgi:SAM-dependent methyltransferase
MTAFGTRDDEIDAALHALGPLTAVLGGPVALLHKKVLVAGARPSLPLAAVLSCHGARVTLLDSVTWDPRVHPGLLREVLVRLRAVAPASDPKPVGQVLRKGGFDCELFRVQSGGLAALTEAGETFDVVVTWDPPSPSTVSNGLLHRLVAVTAYGGWGVHRTAASEPEAERDLQGAGLELRAYEPQVSEGGAGAASSAIVAYRRPHPVGPEYPTPDASAQILAHSRARYEFAAQFARGKRVLDLGCGAGSGTRFLRAAGASQVQGIEKREEALALARAADPEHAATYRQGDLNEPLPYADGELDVAICLEVLEHVSSQSELIAEIRRVLAPEGVAIISVPHEPFEHFWEEMNGASNPYHEHVPDVAEFRRLLGGRFDHVRLFVQTDVVSSMVLPLEEGSDAPRSRDDGRLRTAAAAALRDRDSLTVLAVCHGGGSDAGAIAGPVAVTYGFHHGEIARLTEQLRRVERSALETQHALFSLVGYLRWAVVTARRGKGEGGIRWLAQGVRLVVGAAFRILRRRVLGRGDNAWREAAIDFSLQRDPVRKARAFCTYRPVRKTRRRIEEIRTISMLDVEPLLRLELLARCSRDAVLEIGPYIGGSTSAIASGLRDASRPFVTVEAGGSYPTQPHLPSDDIVADLRKNLARFGVAHLVEVVEGWTHGLATYRRIEGAFGSRRVGLLFVDADGDISSVFNIYGRFLHDDCLLAIDDYYAPGARIKQQLVRPFVDRQVEEGVLHAFGRFGGTWFGQINGAKGLRMLRGRAYPCGGASYRHSFVSPIPADAATDPNRSELRVLEDGVPLGPAHSAYDDVRSKGGGRYSHWLLSADPVDPQRFVTRLYFSASDNSDPNRNGRKYELVMGGQVHALGEV